MEQKSFSKRTKKIGLVIMQIILIIIMIMDAYLFFTHTETTPRFMAAGSFVIMFGIFIFTLFKARQLKK